MSDAAQVRCAFCGAPAAGLLFASVAGPAGAGASGGLARCCPACALDQPARPWAEIAERVEAAYDPDRAAALAAAAEEIDARLQPLLEAVVRRGTGQPVDLQALAAALGALLQFLTRHRSHAHCRHASETISRAGGWTQLPPAYGELVRTIGGPMRDAAWDRPLAEALGATPGQLLAALRALARSE